MDLTTKYLGIDLAHPLMPGSSPLTDDMGMVRRLEDAGAAALVLRSLFEEQLLLEQLAATNLLDRHEDAHVEALSSYYPEMGRFELLPDEYLEHVQRVKSAVGVPLIASLNGVSPGGWLDFAGLIAQAGADALELNVYYLVTDPDEPAGRVEDRIVEMVREVRERVSIPLAVKLAPFYSALPHLAGRLEEAGADGLVLFNRFYQPDIDVDELEVQHRLRLSDSRELPLRLRWLAILSGTRELSLACSGGVHGPLDALKAVLAGADAVQLVSALLRDGPGRLEEVRRGMAEWLEERKYDSLRQMRGSMNLTRCPDPRAYERANYIDILHGWEG